MAYIDGKDIYKLFENGVAHLHVLDIDILPRADVVEVKHGYWERKIKNGRPRGLKCSLCGRSIHFHENYCPECGAKMDGGNAE